MTRSSDGVRLVSNSEVQSFKGCRRKWWLEWYRGLTTRTYSAQGPLSTGTRMHIPLAVYYQPGGTQEAATAALLEAQETDLKRVTDPEDPWTFQQDNSKLLKDFDMERIMLEGYWEWIAETGVDSTLEMVASEQYVEADLVPGVRIIGQLDARVKDVRTDRRKFIDHKNLQAFPDPNLLGINEQLLHYHLLEWLITGEGEARCDEALYNILRKVKRTAKAVPPFYKRVSVTRNIVELENYRKRLTAVVEDIQRVEDQLERGDTSAVYPTPSRDCTWKCQFFKVCRMFDDGSRVEAALEAQYMTHDPLDYYKARERGDEE